MKISDVTVEIEVRRPLEVLGLGAGIQSTTLALMASCGEIPSPNFAVFADTGGEPARVIQHLHWLCGVPYEWTEFKLPSGATVRKPVPQVGVWQGGVLSYPVHVVRIADLEMDLHHAAAGIIKRVANPPVFTPTKDRPGMALRKCTHEYKIAAIESAIRTTLGEEAIKTWRKEANKAKKQGLVTPPPLVRQWFGISVEEVTRIKPMDKPWIVRRDPLVFEVRDGAGMTRYECELWLRKNHYPVPQFSACVFCPFNDKRRWASIKQNQDDWDRALAVDESIRHGLPGLNQTPYLNRSLVPLLDYQLDDEPDGQLWFNFEEECTGMCGV